MCILLMKSQMENEPKDAQAGGVLNWTHDAHMHWLLKNERAGKACAQKVKT
eukprot:CAMPEP_0170635202 /NCGR_PEP_ID=MMETSP0224-20130122/37077_1 /TAXON_ID=285029 /ORGANISM="Togula jolla, Strain CCCM 725" /LENGTH=50 /DNA_ID=CAMNT_0010964649 /DNA_START=76 /DNA_END=224 /DNA_ORIENTATION=+